MKSQKIKIAASLALFFLSAVLNAQTTAFSYQGRLSEAGAPVAGNRLFRFTLFDEKGAAIPGASVEQTLIVTNGIFTTSLDFGAANFAGANRTLEIAVKVNAGDPYTVLAPRQQILATPFSIRSIAASAADAVSSACVLCISDAQINTVDGSKITGMIPVATVPTGSGNYIQNASSPLNRGNGVQKASFNVDGEGVVGGTLSANVVDAATQFNIAGIRILGNPGTSNLFAGVSSGANNPGEYNTFVGASAGQESTMGTANSFFGVSAGFNNRGTANSFFGRSAGFQNTTGEDNAFFGTQSGRDNTTGHRNSFFGRGSGIFNTSGIANTFVGAFAGGENKSGNFNTFIGNNAGFLNTDGYYNTYVGLNTGVNNLYGHRNSYLGAEAGIDSIGNENTYIGYRAGFSDFLGSNNTFVGFEADLGGGNAVSHATAIGSGAKVTTSNTIMLGTSTDKVIAAGKMRVSSIPLDVSSAAVCFNVAGDLLQCGASSLRLKTNVHPFFDGLSVLRQLRPISYNWKDGGAYDIGLGAEDVAKVAPSLVFSNKKGEAEGVKYERLNLLLINAVKEQQKQIEDLRAANAELSARLRAVEKLVRKKTTAGRRR